MKRFIRLFAILISSLLLILASAAFNRSIYAQSEKITSMAVFFQTTTTPQPQADRSEIGSTDKITIMSFAIVAIIIVPILLLRKYWSQT